jgi:hypothetical protein
MKRVLVAGGEIIGTKHAVLAASSGASFNLLADHLLLAKEVNG